MQLDPVDLRGLPRIAADQTEWVPPKFLPTTGKGILFLDELTSAPQMTQAGCYQLVLDRKLGEYLLPDGWVVIAAGNPASERGVHFSMPRPLRNRFVHLDLEAGPRRLVQVGGEGWGPAGDHRLPALQAGAPAYGRRDVGRQCLAHAALLGDGLERALTGFARRQKTSFLSGTSEFEAQLLDGTVGPAAASELVAFLRLFRQLAVDRRNPAQSRDGAVPDGAVRADRDRHRAGQSPDRQLDRAEGSRISTGCRPRCA